eukprot:TRINITY_DN15805_c0_g3_i1.p1 TRINITY_DN15805_c0_g3~~TRINITY_DN15805_c0_g3_i1.p1  ORF type:complete len:1880 (+),score=225.18 TRINITY_DN15805_c0_g3_i1:225-5864(+)
MRSTARRGQDCRGTFCIRCCRSTNIRWWVLCLLIAVVDSYRDSYIRSVDFDLSPEKEEEDSKERQHSVSAFRADTLPSSDNETYNPSALLQSTDAVATRSGWLDSAEEKESCQLCSSAARLKGHRGAVAMSVFSPDGMTLVSGSLACDVIVWKASPKDHTKWVKHSSFEEGGDDCQKNDAYVVALSPNEMQIVTVSQFKAILWQWDQEGLKWQRRQNLLEGPFLWAIVATFSPDGTHFVSAEGREVHVWSVDLHDAALWRKQTTIGHTSDVTSVAFSPDSLNIVVGMLSASAAVWSMTDEAGSQGWRKPHDAESHVLPGHREGSSGLQTMVVAWAPAGDFVVTADTGGIVVWRDIGTSFSGPIFRLEGTLEGHRTQVWCLAFAPDGKQFVSVSEDDIALVWQLQGERWFKLHSFEGHRKVNWAAFGPKMIATTSPDSSVTDVWSVSTSKLVEWDILAELQGPEGDEYSQTHSVAFAPDGRRLVSALADSRAAVWIVDKTDPTKWHRQAMLKGHNGGLTSVAFAPHGMQIVTGSEDKTAVVWVEEDSAGGDCRENCTDAVWVPKAKLEGHSSSVTTVAFSPDGKQIATGSSDGTAIIWTERCQDNSCEKSSWRKEAELRGGKHVFSVAFSVDGFQLVMASKKDPNDSDPGATVWARREQSDGHSPQQWLKQAVVAGHGPPEIVAFENNGKRIVTGHSDGHARVWQTGSDMTASWTLQAILKGLPQGGYQRINPLVSVALSPTGRQIVAASYDTVVVWRQHSRDASKWHREGVWGGGVFNGVLTSATFAPNGRQIALGIRGAADYILQADEDEDHEEKMHKGLPLAERTPSTSPLVFRDSLCLFARGLGDDGAASCDGSTSTWHGLGSLPSLTVKKYSTKRFDNLILKCLQPLLPPVDLLHIVDGDGTVQITKDESFFLPPAVKELRISASRFDVLAGIERGSRPLLAFLGSARWTIETLDLSSTDFSGHMLEEFADWMPSLRTLNLSGSLVQSIHASWMKGRVVDVRGCPNFHYSDVANELSNDFDSSLECQRRMQLQQDADNASTMTSQTATSPPCVSMDGESTLILFFSNGQRGTLHAELADLCREGEYRNTNRQCRACDIGKYSSKIERYNCKKCPGQRLTIQTGETSKEACVCPSGYLDDGNENCLECPIGFDCTANGTKLAEAHVKPGYWKSRNGTARCCELACATPDALAASGPCKGGPVEDQCRSGHTGPKCRACEENYFKPSSGLCSACQGKATNGAVAGCLLLVVCLLMVRPICHGLQEGYLRVDLPKTTSVARVNLIEVTMLTVQAYQLLALATEIRSSHSKRNPFEGARDLQVLQFSMRDVTDLTQVGCWFGYYKAQHLILIGGALQPLVISCIVPGMLCILGSEALPWRQWLALAAQVQPDVFNLLFVGGVSSLLDLGTCDSDFDGDEAVLLRLPDIGCNSSAARLLMAFAAIIGLAYVLIQVIIFVLPVWISEQYLQGVNQPVFLRAVEQDDIMCLEAQVCGGSEPSDQQEAAVAGCCVIAASFLCAAIPTLEGDGRILFDKLCGDMHDGTSKPNCHMRLLVDLSKMSEAEKCACAEHLRQFVSRDVQRAMEVHLGNSTVRSRVYFSKAKHWSHPWLGSLAHINKYKVRWYHHDLFLRLHAALLAYLPTMSNMRAGSSIGACASAIALVIALSKPAARKSTSESALVTYGTLTMVFAIIFLAAGVHYDVPVQFAYFTLVLPLLYNIYAVRYLWKDDSCWQDRRLWLEHFIAKAAYCLIADDLKGLHEPTASIDCLNVDWKDLRTVAPVWNPLPETESFTDRMFRVLRRGQLEYPEHYRCCHEEVNAELLVKKPTVTTLSTSDRVVILRDHGKELVEVASLEHASKRGWVPRAALRPSSDKPAKREEP